MRSGGSIMELLSLFGFSVKRPNPTLGFWISLLVFFQHSIRTFSASSFLVGLGSYDITGPAADVNMMGYANTEQIASGIHFRLRARTFIVAEPQGNRIVFVNLDACMASQLVKIRVIERLKSRYSFTSFVFASSLDFVVIWKMRTVIWKMRTVGSGNWVSRNFLTETILDMLLDC